MIIKRVDIIADDDIKKYSEIDPSFEVKFILEMISVNNGLGGIKFVEKRVKPYLKNYDELPGNHPKEWHTHFTLENASMMFVVEDEMDMAAATILRNENCQPGGVVEIYDIRVSPEFRGRGFGQSLIRSIAEFSKSLSAGLLRAETQNTNVNACKFYSGNGFMLGGIDRFGYEEPELRHEIKLLWYKEL